MFFGMRKYFRRGMTMAVVFTTIVWSIGISALLPTMVKAVAVTASGPTDLLPSMGMMLPASSMDAIVLKFALNKTPGGNETLSSVTVTVTSTLPTNNATLASHIANLTVYRDNNSNNYFDPEFDVATGAQTTVNVGSATTIATNSNNSLAADGALPTTFFVTLMTAPSWATGDAVFISMAANGIVTSANSPTVTPLTGTKQIYKASDQMGGFSVANVSYINATTLDVVFTDYLDLMSGTATSTSAYTLTGAGAAAVTSVNVLPDNKSARVTASGASLVSTGASFITVSNTVKSIIGMANINTSANPIYGGEKPLVISEIKAGSATDQYDEFVELYNRTSGTVATSTIKLHLINAAGTADVNVNLTFLSTVNNVPAHGFLLLAPITSPASSTADAVYSTSTASIVPDGAAHISNSTASSTAVVDKVCWGNHLSSPSLQGDCESAAAFALTNNGQSIERKAFSGSTSATMLAADATMGNGMDTQNNSYDFVARTSPEPQNTGSTIETPSGGAYGGDANQQPTIFHSPTFLASSDSSLNLIARMSDDGGLPSAANTQLIFCTTDTTCTPASSTPIYGTNVGSGWYKFSSTSTGWANGKTKFRYYLQVSDSATPPKSRVLTNDPNYDSVTYIPIWTGIQTATDQANKALVITLQSGNLGSASISGTVVSTQGAAVSGATVWIEGTQFAATTGNDGSFSFSNVGPSGGKQIIIAKEGYADLNTNIYIPSSGLVALTGLTMNQVTGGMGQGGDFSTPKVMGGFPMPGMMSFPTQDPSGNPQPLDINFSKEMNSATFVTTTAGGSTSNMYLTEAGSGTRVAGVVTAPTASSARFTPSAALTAGRAYTLFLTSAVKDSAGNPVTSNSNGGVYVLQFSTASGMFSTPGEITGFGTGNAFPPYVIGSQPAPGKVNVAPNTTKVFVTFSEGMQNSSGSLANVKLYKVISPYTASETKTLVSMTNSLDTSQEIVILTGTLESSSNYRIEVWGGIASAKGITLGNPGSSGYGTNIMYKSDFSTGSTNDTTAPTVAGTIPADSATGVSTIQPIVISFSEAVSPATITENSVSLKLGSSAVASSLSYDPNNRTVTLVPTYALSPTSTYTISVTTAVQDLAGNALDQDSTVSGSQSLQRLITTGSADTSAPTVISAQANDFAVKVNFSKPMLAVTANDSGWIFSVLNKDNVTIRRVNGTTGATLAVISLPAASTLSYDPASRGVAINSVSGFATGDFANIIVNANVKDIGYNALASGGNAATTTALTSAKMGNFGGGPGMGPMMDAGGNIMQGGMMGGPPPMVGTYVDSGIGFAPGVKVFPFNRMAGVSTIYGIEIPISYQVPNAGFIDITFPEGTTVTNAKKDTDSPPNTDLNGPGPGVVVFGASEGTLPSGWTTGGASNDGVIVNTSSRTVRVILGAVATRRGAGNLTSGDGDQHDYVRLDIAQIVNSTLSSGVDTSGSSATVETKTAGGTLIESLSSGSFFTTAAGNFTVRGVVTTTASGINGANVFLMSPMTGPMSSSSAAGRFGGNNGEFMFQNLNAGSYMLGVEQYFKAGGTTYTSSFPTPINVNATDCPSNICTRNISVTDASTGAAVTLNISGTFSNTAIDIFAGGPGSFRKATSTLDGVLTGDTSNSIKLNANGIWMVGFGPQMSNEIFGKSGPAAPTTWMPPRPQEVLVSGCPSACSVNPSTVTFNVSAADKTVKFIVRDASGNAIANAHVFAYSPNGGFGNGTSANSDGTGSMKVGAGMYKIGADVSGMPGGGERTVNIVGANAYIDGSSAAVALATMANTDLILTISKPSYTISGRVTDGTNATANASVSAYRTDGPGNSNTFTNSSGDYTLYVGNGTWKVNVFTPDYGKLPEKTITVSSASVTGQNFEPNTASTNYATFTKSVAIDADADGVLDSGEGVSNAQVIVQGTTSAGNTYFNSGLTDTNGSSTLKLPPGAYTMKAWSPTYGEMSSSTQSVVVNSSGTVTTAPHDVLAPKSGTVTVNILDSNGSPTTTIDAVIDFQQIGGKIEKVESFGNTPSTTVSLPQFDVANALNAVTSTNPANMYLFEVNIPGISQSALTVYGDSNTVLATSTAANGFWKMEVDGNTETVNVKLPDLKFINGAVKDADGTALASATVHLENVSTGETVETQTDSSGNYSTKVSSGTYLVKADKDGYIDTASSVTISANGTVNATTTAATYTITGTIKTSGTAVSGATVRAEKLGGGIATAMTGNDGTYTLYVIGGNWKVSASADGYSEKAYTSVVTVGASGASGINIDITTTNSSLAGSASMSMTPQSGASFSDATANVSVSAPEAALGSSANTYSLNEKETSNVVGGGAGAPIGNEAKTISSYDNDGEAVTLLNKDVAVSASYSNAELTTSLGALTIAALQKIKMGSWDSTADNWQNLPTTIAYKNSSGNFIEPSASASTVAFTGQTGHFSVFNPIAPSDSLAPSAPTSLTATAGNATVALSWTAPTTNADTTALTDLLGYELYRATSVGGTYTQLNTSNITGTSYTDSTVSNGSTYYYKVTAGDTGGMESDYSSVSNAASPASPASSTGGSSGVLSTPPSSASVAINSGATTVITRAITLTLSASNAIQMAISNTADFAGVSYETYSTTKPWTLTSGSGAKTVYVRFRSNDGGVAVTSINIKLDDGTTPVTVVTPKAIEAAPPATTLIKSVQAVQTVGNVESKVIISDLSAVFYQPGEQLKFNYQYKNEGAKSATVKIIRQLLNAKGKVLKTATAMKTIKSGKAFAGIVKDTIAKTQTPGEYTVRIKILDKKNKVLEENSFVITVEKLKKKVFTMGAAEQEEADIVFDSKLLSKIKSGGAVPLFIKLKYSYTNNSGGAHKVKLVRELLDSDGKVLSTKAGKWQMAIDEKDSASVSQLLNNNLPAGDYKVRIAAYDWTTKELLAENSVGFAIELK